MALYGRARNTRLLVITLVMASLLIITVDYRGGQRGPFEVAGRATSTVVGAMQAGVSKVLHPIAAFVGGVAHIGSLKAENDQLRARVRQLEAQSGTTDSTQRVNDALLKLFSLQGTLNLRGVAARVIAESVGNFEWSVNIEQGSSRGVQLNMSSVMSDGLAS